MIAGLHIPPYLRFAMFSAFGWFALFLAVAMLIRGRSWVWAQFRKEWRRIIRNRLRRRGVLGRPLPQSPDEPIGFTPRAENR